MVTTTTTTPTPTMALVLGFVGRDWVYFAVRPVGEPVALAVVVVAVAVALVVVEIAFVAVGFALAAFVVAAAFVASASIAAVAAGVSWGRPPLVSRRRRMLAMLRWAMEEVEEHRSCSAVVVVNAVAVNAADVVNAPSWAVLDVVQAAVVLAVVARHSGWRIHCCCCCCCCCCCLRRRCCCCCHCCCDCCCCCGPWNVPSDPFCSFSDIHCTTLLETDG